MGKADLHLHTLYSDGYCDPETLVKTAHDKGLEAISVTDHDSMNAYPELITACRDHRLMLVPGAEMTALHSYKDPMTEEPAQKEVHLLAYGLDPQNEDVQRLIILQKKARKDRIKAILNLLRSKGIELTMEDILAESMKGNPGRPHIAKALIRSRFASSVADAFIRYIGNDQIKGIEKNYLHLQEMISQVQTLGGVAILAHPELSIRYLNCIYLLKWDLTDWKSFIRVIRMRFKNNSLSLRIPVICCKQEAVIFTVRLSLMNPGLERLHFPCNVSACFKMPFQGRVGFRIFEGLGYDSGLIQNIP